MDVFLTYGKIYASNGKDDYKQNYCRGRCIGGETAAVTVELVIYVTNDGVHLSGVEVCSENRNCITVSFECSDKSRNNEIGNNWRYHGQSNFVKGSEFRRTVDLGGVIVILLYRSKCACENEDLEGQNHPNCIEAKNEHFCGIRTVDEIHGSNIEQSKKQNIP